MSLSSSSSDRAGHLRSNHSGLLPEAGCDEAGRGCLAGPVTAAAVILPEGLVIPGLDDSKKISEKERYRLRDIIISKSLFWSVAEVDNDTIDEINILQASITAMHNALGELGAMPSHIVVDGNHFRPFGEIPHSCVPKADGLFLHVAAASVLAKTFRDERMQDLHREFPVYGWDRNKGYPTPAHKASIVRYGLTSYHRRSFNHGTQLRIDL